MRNVSPVTLVMKWELAWSLVLAEAVVIYQNPTHCDFPDFPDITNSPRT